MIKIFSTLVFIVSIASCGGGGSSTDANSGSNNNPTLPADSATWDTTVWDSDNAKYAVEPTIGSWDAVTYE